MMDTDILINVSNSSNLKQISSHTALLIIKWINSIFSPNNNNTITSLKDLQDGIIFINLIRILLDDEKQNMMNSVNLNDVNLRYDLVKLMIQSSCNIESGIRYDLVKNNNELELGKIALVLLMHGVHTKNNVFIEACESLDIELYSLIDTFYFLLDKNNLFFPPTDMQIYEEFLCLPAISHKTYGKVG